MQRLINIYGKKNAKRYQKVCIYSWKIRLTLTHCHTHIHTHSLSHTELLTDIIVPTHLEKIWKFVSDWDDLVPASTER
jgi:hypothetical protein